MERIATERGREVRRGLLAAAVELITELGWNAVSTRILAERAGVRPGLVHYHFASLPALLNEAATGAIARFADTAPLTAELSLDDGLDLLVGTIAEAPGAISLLFSETYLAATRDPDLRRRVGELTAAFNSSLAGWLASHGHPAPSPTATVLTAALDGLALHKALDPALDLVGTKAVLRAILHPEREGNPS
ncbi:TetR/AcrR family transcriptional regulator [Phytomonospora sp. NPDC050363]|uniref:TetR/AcrR family transcriptional regulator n=1 Tax=Phytomonospora sp. NPDC050363 TaxID=3155642 RepID=UPI0033EFC7DB